MYRLATSTRLLNTTGCASSAGMNAIISSFSHIDFISFINVVRSLRDICEAREEN